ncbi:MAG: polysaccharide biosynthesis tyrosine autokinase [Candidatus Aminicenantes bacterium]|nr:polysaccharide biosynthesis tyrosine autokinase [Candidatus Aminicenantes bacterium]
MVHTATGKKEVSLLEYWRIVLKRKWVIVSVTAVLLAASGVMSFTSTPLYRAGVTILIEDPGSSMLTIQDLLSTSTGSTDWMGTYFNTQLKILQSRLLAERVAKKMNLAARAELLEPSAEKGSLLRMVKTVFSLRWLKGRSGPAPEATPPIRAEDPSAAYAGFVIDGLGVVPVAETRLVSLTFTSPYPRLAADVANTMAQEYINYSIESRFEATQQTTDFLNEQIARIREELAAKQRELTKYTDQKKIVPLNDKESSVVGQYADQFKVFNEAQLARINAEASYRELSGLKADSLPQLVNNPTIQSLRTTYVTLQSDLAEKSRTLGPSNPDLIATKTRLDSTKTQLEGEIKKAADAAYVAWQTALGKERTMDALLAGKRSEVSRMSNENIFAESLDREIQSRQELLKKLQDQQATTDVSARLNGLKTSNIKIVDPAVVPEAPFSPAVKRNLMVALLLGLLLGLGLAFVSDFLDNSIKGPEDLEKLTGLPSLGIIPHFSAGSTRKKNGYANYGGVYGAADGGVDTALAKVTEVELINHLFPKISIAEDYRTVRTAILFSHPDSAPRTIAFTSTSPEEGKSATLANLAISFAQLGDRVLAVDADLRKPRLAKVFQVRNLTGLSGVLTGRATLDDAIQKTAIDNLWVLPGGPHPPNPAELLNSRKMKELLVQLKEQFSVVLIDLPPVLAVIDPVIVSSMVDSTVLVIKTGKATRKPLLKTIEELRKGKASIIGAIFNDSKARKSGLSSNYFQYEYYQDPGTAPPESRKGQPQP